MILSTNIVIVTDRAFLTDTAEEMETLKSESTRDRKDKARDALLADMSSSNEGSGDEKASSSKEKNTITARDALLADDSDKEQANISDLNKKGRRELLADDSSDNENVEKSSQVGESNGREALLGETLSPEGIKNNKAPNKKLAPRGRQELLADRSSDDEVSERLEGSSRTKKNQKGKGRTSPNAEKSGRAKDREALLADNSSGDEEEKTADTKLEKSHCEDKKGRDALLADNSSDDESKIPPKLSKKKKIHDKNGGKELFVNGSSDDDKENLKAAKPSNECTKDSVKERDGEILKNDIVSGKHKKGKVEDLGNSDVSEEEDVMGFVVLGQYNASTNEINKLDDDFLVQLDGAGKIFE